MRSGDLVAFLYVKGRLMLVENFTIHQYVRIFAGGGCAILLIAIGASSAIGLWGIQRLLNI